MSEEKVVKVVCSDCGLKFDVGIHEEEFDPPFCPNCQNEITALSVPPDGARTIAFTEDKK